MRNFLLEWTMVSVGFQSANFLCIWLICVMYMYAAATSCIYPEQPSAFNYRRKAPALSNLSQPRWSNASNFSPSFY
ncbi:hypothetical protein ARMSODRAFT_63468 [Armillaria solidipes]|uniref:Uncharacterized protein n=1 Tax=Armillaria solidipes TaxID=1076256 RepID=A0A2H3BJR1_9AGAR|nr:hypothetical protein ARMSODRAFT_63468 [Armillaria solidipes]